VRAAVVLFTRDLRVHDNPALAAAAREAELVLPLFVLDEKLLVASERRARLVGSALRDLDGSLRRLGARLVVRRGDPVAETVKVARACGARTVFLAEDVSAYARRRERRLAGQLEVRAFPGVTVVPPGAVAPAGRDCYRVFTPYARAWAAAPWRALESRPSVLRLPPGVAPGRLPAGEPGGGETDARAMLARWLRSGDRRYAEHRDDLAADATSRLSIPLHLGLLSPLEVASRSRSPELVRQLAWRDFFAQLLAANPHLATDDLHPGRREWRDDQQGLAAWKEGQTGVPIVDAGMRELAATGFMHNRARMIVASFLTKDLAVDWRDGAAHFSRLLLDGDLASNTGNWQWIAGTGADTRPGRIFNPARQAARFDPDGEYVRRWVPEVGSKAYPAPIVDHEQAAARFRAGRV
jgi:deoxyribodipyrimidine photo-lyase